MSEMISKKFRESLHCRSIGALYFALSLHCIGSLLKMAPIKDGSFGPIATTAAATPPPRRGGGLKKIGLFFVLERFKPFWTVFNRFATVFESFWSVLGPFELFLRRFGPFSDRNLEPSLASIYWYQAIDRSIDRPIQCRSID